MSSIGGRFDGESDSLKCFTLDNRTFSIPLKGPDGDDRIYVLTVSTMTTAEDGHVTTVYAISVGCTQCGQESTNQSDRLSFDRLAARGNWIAGHMPNCIAMPPAE